MKIIEMVSSITLNALLLSGRRRGFVRRRLTLLQPPRVTYAVGDVHGSLDLLMRLEAIIAEDAKQHSGTKLIVLLGDYVDRGPYSAQVIDYLLSEPPKGFRRICLAGNHDELALRCLTVFDDLSAWRALGGEETLRSYGLDDKTISLFFSASNHQRKAIVKACVPQSHLAFFDSLPVALSFPGYVFVHGGLKQGAPLDAHDDHHLQTIRLFASTADDQLRKFVIVHGHTPVEWPLVSANRIAIDLDPVATGRLCAVRLIPNEPATPLVADAAVGACIATIHEDASTLSPSREVRHG